MATGLVGIGYEGRSIDEFVADLAGRGVTRVVDVRLNPISHKRGFSKNGLGAALASRGIAYEHRGELGSPKEYRAGFRGSEEDLAAARERFGELLGRPDAAEALDDLAEAAGRELVAVLCFEADERRCHRYVVLQAVAARTARKGSRPRHGEAQAGDPGLRDGVG